MDLLNVDGRVSRMNAFLAAVLLFAATPSVFLARIETTKGVVLVEVHRAWAPNGADRFYELATSGFFNGNPILHTVGGWTFGIPGDPAVGRPWQSRYALGDPSKDLGPMIGVGLSSDVVCSEQRNRTTTRVIIGRDSKSAQCSSPFGRVVAGRDALDLFDDSYGTLTRAEGPFSEERIENEGDAMLAKEFPKLDRVKSVTIVTP